jgi:hypothetical protein
VAYDQDTDLRHEFWINHDCGSPVFIMWFIDEPGI